MGGRLIVHGRALAFRIGLVVVGIEHLDLVAGPHQADAVVAPPLAVALDHLGRSEFEVELAVAERLLVSMRPLAVKPPSSSTFQSLAPFQASKFLPSKSTTASLGRGVFARRDHWRLGPDDAADVALPRDGGQADCEDGSGEQERFAKHVSILSVLAYP